MIASGFTAAPVSQFLLFGLIASSILVSITDTKYLFYIQVVPHLWQYKQAWRLLIWQVNLTFFQNFISWSSVHGLHFTVPSMNGTEKYGLVLTNIQWKDLLQ